MLGRTEANLLKMLTKRKRNILRMGEKRGRGGDAGANSDTGVLSEASQSLLITWNKVGQICTKFKLQTSFSGLEYF